MVDLRDGDRGRHGPDPSRADSVAEFVVLLGELRVWAGGPSYRRLAGQVGPLLHPQQTVTHSTIADAFQPRRRRLSLDLVVAIVRALGLDEPTVARWRDACVAVHAGAKSGGQAGVFRQLPADLATFVGRDDDLKDLISHATSEALGTASVVVSAVEGMAGIGKTQLAVHAAHQLVRAGKYADVQLYVNLCGFDPDRAPLDPAAVLEAFLRALEVPGPHIPEGLSERAAMFRDRIHGRDALILLDNAADEEQVRELIPASPSCLVLVTSRRSLAGLDGAAVHQLDVFSPAEAVALLARIAGPDRVHAEPEAAAEVVRACGRLPLAVALTASRLRARPAWKVADLAEMLRARGLNALTAGGRSLVPVFDLSYRALPADARRLFALLGIQPGSDITASAAAALADIAPVEALVALELLNDEHLLQQRIPGRYDLHDLLRAYAAERAASDLSAEDRDEAIIRVLTWYMVHADAAGRALYPARYSAPIPEAETRSFTARFDSSAKAMAWCESEKTNLVDAAEAAATRARPYLAWRIPVAISTYLGLLGKWQEWERLHLIALDFARRAADPAAEAWVLTNLGSSGFMLGTDIDGAEARLTAALAIRRSLGDHRGETTTLNNLVSLRRKVGDPAMALDYARQALAVARQAGDRAGESSVLLNLAGCLQELDRPQEALDHMRVLTILYREEGDLRGIGSSLLNIGFLHLVLRRFDIAAETYQEAVQVFQDSGDRYFQAMALNGIGRSMKGLRRTAEAREHHEQALAIFEDLGAAEAAPVRERLARLDVDDDVDAPLSAL